MYFVAQLTPSFWYLLRNWVISIREFGDSGVPKLSPSYLMQSTQVIKYKCRFLDIFSFVDFKATEPPDADMLRGLELTL